MFGNVARGSRLLLGKTRDDESATSQFNNEKFTLQDPGWLGVQKVSKARQTDTMVVEGSLMVPARGATPEA